MIDGTGRTHSEIARDNAKADVDALEKMLGLHPHRDLLKDAMDALFPIAFAQRRAVEILPNGDTCDLAALARRQISWDTLEKTRTTYDKLKAALEPDKEKP